jgi:hypothetical protein
MSNEKLAYLTAALIQLLQIFSSLAVMNTSKAIITTGNDPLILSNHSYLDQNIMNDDMGKGLDKLHGGEDVMI